MLKYCYGKYLFLNCPNWNDMGVRILRYMHGKKKDKLGTLVFKDILSKEVLIWKHVQSELVKDYRQLLQRLLDLGYEIKALITPYSSTQLLAMVN